MGTCGDMYVQESCKLVLGAWDKTKPNDKIDYRSCNNYDE